MPGQSQEGSEPGTLEEQALGSLWLDPSSCWGRQRYLKENKPGLESQLHRAEHLLAPSLSFLSWRRKSTLGFYEMDVGDKGFIGHCFESFYV